MRSAALTALLLTAAVVFPVRGEETGTPTRIHSRAGSGRSWRGTASSATGPTTRRGRPSSGWTPRRGRKAGGFGAVPIVPGKPDESELVLRIFAEDASERMPPAAAKLPLAEPDKQVLKRWIADGAEYKTHWAFIPPQSATAAASPPRKLAPERRSMRSSWPGSRPRGCGRRSRRTARP